MTPVSRRSVLAGLSMGGVALGRMSPARALDVSTTDRLHALEDAAGGRLGVAALDLADGTIWQHRGDERFALCSTFKFLAAAYVLARVDRGEESLARRISYQRTDLVDYSPVTERYAGTPGMDVADLCDAAVTLSDNTAANLMLASFGGPAGLTQFLRSLDDEVTRLDRIEPELNEATPDDPRDTTTPMAMLGLMQRILTSDVLKPDSRAMLINWLKACQTGDTRLRAGFPEGWVVGDKTGTGHHGTTNDIAIGWRPGHAPILIAAYYTGSNSQQATRDYVLADVARTITYRIGR